ncbi:MAG: hypothetical protein HWE21_15370 [Cytophagia bacterium]|nr:hypothetical protein [Cytophagia bacterium]
MPFIQKNEKVIGLHKVGKIHIGMQADELYGYYDYESLELFDQFLEATFSPAFSIKNELGEVELVAELDCNVIWRVKVFSPDYKTEEDLHIGSTLGDLKKHFAFNEVLQGEGNVAVSSKERKLSFLLDVLQMDELGIDIFKKLEIDDIPDSIRVAAILVL